MSSKNSKADAIRTLEKYQHMLLLDSLAAIPPGACDDFEPSSETMASIDRITEQYILQRPVRAARKVRKRIAIAFIAALLAALIAAMTVTAVREAIIKYYDGLYFSISDVQEPIDSSIDKNEIFIKNMTVKDVYAPYELPHGYIPTLYGPSNRDPGEAFEIEYRSQTKRMIFKQRSGSVDEATLSTPIIVDGQTYYYADDVPDPKYPCELMWQADGIIFSIGGDLKATEMIEMAKSVALK